MLIYDRFALVALAAVWGCNFTVIKVGLVGMPPLLLCALRFLLVALPAVFFLPRPKVALKAILLYGLLMFALQFSLLFAGMYLGMSAGLASLALQAQVFVTIGLAGTIMGEKISSHQVAGAIVASAGLCVLGAGMGGDVTVPGLACVLGAACAWAGANIVSRRRLGGCNPLAVVAWGSLVAIVPVFAASLLLEGPARIQSSLVHMSGTSAAAIAYIVYPTTLAGFAVWAWQIGRHPLAAVVPYTLLVPIFGLASAAIFLGEPLQAWKLTAACLVIGGLAINQFGRRTVEWMAAKAVRVRT